ncbi:uncharacterized protein LOC116774708 [Danaus plexippus]|uniref:uncharacterized protein LOC116774708 n=1 Tax=Danaus plexippus TaxID=13037 RepID=UPI002AB133C4|nr:uncharacterized protein LOC116774708 [Danaus plexippus]
MASIVMQKDLVITLKKETILNVGILSKLQPMLPELSRLIFKESALDKPTQNLFNQLSHYLVSIIDPQVYASLTWPLYDTKAERTYRNEFSVFISDYSSKGLLTPVMSSYLVNAGCYKVTVLMFQLSQLAVNRMLQTKMVKENKKSLYSDMTEKFKAHEKDGFLECIEKETDIMLSKFSNYLSKRHIMENIAELFRKKITAMDNKLSQLKAQSFINDLVDNFVSKNDLDDASREQILKIKNPNEQSLFFDNWLQHVGQQTDGLEHKWTNKVSPLLDQFNVVHDLTEAVINRHTGQVERSSYTLEYDPKVDRICTKELQSYVNTQQTYILKNIERAGCLNFPNLIRAFVISICYILKNNEIGNEVYKFNQYLEGANHNFGGMVSALKILIERLLNAEARLQPSSLEYRSVCLRQYPEIPLLPDLSELKISRDQYHTVYETFTPLNLTRHHFNLRRRNSGTFAKPQSRSLIQPFYQLPKDEFLRSLKTCRRSYNENLNMTQNVNNISMISNINKVNETIAECSSGFTKQQILRLLSTKKSGSSKKLKYTTEHTNIKIKKGGLFNESVNSNESNGLFRSYSSPNLFENKDRRSFNKIKGRKLSIMKEDSSSQLEVSGITCIDQDSNYNSPHGLGNAESSRNLDSTNIPIITVTNDSEKIINKVNNIQILTDLEMDSTVSPILEVPRSIDITPKTNTSVIRKTSSLEKIINRFKKVRASVIPDREVTDIKTIEEENFNGNFEMYTANRNLLPDLLSPSCSVWRNVNSNCLDEFCLDLDEVETRKPRESLGTALGVDQTFLDQFDLID